MADLRHCDRKGCDKTEPCDRIDGFRTMSHFYRGNAALRFCSWACLSAEAAEYVQKEAAEKAESVAYWEEFRRGLLPR